MPTGKIKWYSSEKGYGFIAVSNDDGYEDYFFHISSIIGADPPKEGHVVEFREESGKKGKVAREIKIIGSPNEIPKPQRVITREGTHKRDDRVECRHCGKRMVPRIQFRRGEPHARLCPYCMKSQEACFVATAAFGDHEHPTVVRLREFRDKILIKYEFGKNFVDLYYRKSPAISEWLEKRDALKPTARVFLCFISLLTNLLVRFVGHWR